jgi:xanthosine utilization system XapX-like protein
MRQTLIICAVGILMGLFWSLLAMNGASSPLMMAVGGASGILLGLIYKATSKK